MAQILVVGLVGLDLFFVFGNAEEREGRQLRRTWDEKDEEFWFWLFWRILENDVLDTLVGFLGLLLLLLSLLLFLLIYLLSLVVFFLYIVNRKQLILFLSRFFRYKYCILFFLNFLISLVYISRCLPRKEIQIRISKMFPRLFVLCCCCCCLP